nr:immunoglobulin heavy chain junction region [Mus musculus]
CVRAPCDYW